jgi:hypothetical protein
MNDSIVKVFESITGWREHSNFENDHEGYITTERLGDAVSMFLWRVDKEPRKIDHTFLMGKTFVRFSDNFH